VCAFVYVCIYACMHGCVHACMYVDSKYLYYLRHESKLLKAASSTDKAKETIIVYIYIYTHASDAPEPQPARMNF